ncbi:MAG: nucleotide exchange factor GrpE [Patescibacteria group bacterium]|jgi:molecular chaperone GrpE
MMDDKKIKDEENAGEANDGDEATRGDEAANEDGMTVEENEKPAGKIKPDYEDKYKRALADYQNLLKRTAEEKSECARYANENLLMEILPVYDNLKLALKHANCSGEKVEKKDNSIEKGIEYVTRQFKSVLEMEGVKEIETAGKKYDHAVMEAMSHKETDDKKLDGMVAEELRPGYTLNGRVIIPARVVVYEFKV